MLAVRNNRTKEEVQQDLDEFISENAPDFVNWLWEEAPKVCKQPETKKEAESKPKAKPTQPKKSSGESKTKSKDNSANLMKKAIDDTQKKGNKQGNKQKNKGKESSSYVQKDKDGRKVISFNKSGKEEQEREEKYGHHRQGRDSHRDTEKASNSNVFDRLTKKGTDSGKGFLFLAIALDFITFFYCFDF